MDALDRARCARNRSGAMRRQARVADGTKIRLMSFQLISFAWLPVYTARENTLGGCAAILTGVKVPHTPTRLAVGLNREAIEGTVIWMKH